jgi:hypothetical protein
MLPHVASIAALFVDQVQQAPAGVQCAQTAPEPWWKWWVQSVIPVAGGSLIAIWSFVQNRKSENEQWLRNQKTTREQWIRDQKKGEWSLLLRSVASVYQITDLVIGWNRKIADRIVSELEPALKEVSIARANCVFLDKFRLNSEGGEKIREFLRFAEIQSQKVRGNLGLFDSIEDQAEKAGSRTDEDNKSLLRCVEVVSVELSTLAAQSHNLLVWLQNEAELDLVKTSEGSEHGATMR